VKIAIFCYAALMFAGFLLLDICGAILGICCAKIIIRWQIKRHFANIFFDAALDFLENQAEHLPEATVQIGQYNFFNFDFADFFYCQIGRFSYLQRLFLLELFCAKRRPSSAALMSAGQHLRLKEVDCKMLKTVYNESSKPLYSELGFGQLPSLAEVRSRIMFWANYYKMMANIELSPEIDDHIATRKEAIIRTYALLNSEYL